LAFDFSILEFFSEKSFQLGQFNKYKSMAKVLTTASKCVPNLIVRVSFILLINSKFISRHFHRKHQQ
jgi:hypothetical protein